VDGSIGLSASGTAVAVSFFAAAVLGSARNDTAGGGDGLRESEAVDVGDIVEYLAGSVEAELGLGAGTGSTVGANATVPASGDIDGDLGTSSDVQRGGGDTFGERGDLLVTVVDNGEIVGRGHNGDDRDDGSSGEEHCKLRLKVERRGTGEVGCGWVEWSLCQRVLPYILSTSLLLCRNLPFFLKP
jgi:hypothetical protein